STLRTAGGRYVTPTAIPVSSATWRGGLSFAESCRRWMGGFIIQLMRPSRWIAATAAVLFLGLSGCSSFDRDYRQAMTGAAADGIEGAWQGRWESQGGHGGGGLRAVLTRTAPDVCHARFRARFWGIFEADEDVDLHTSGTSPVRASGEAD